MYIYILWGCTPDSDRSRKKWKGANGKGILLAEIKIWNFDGGNVIAYVLWLWMGTSTLRDINILCHVPTTVAPFSRPPPLPPYT